MRLLLVAAIFVVDVWALTDILGTTMRRRHRLKWIVLVVGVPVVGIILWRRR